MTVALRSLRVSADMDVNGYVAGMNQKVAADKAGAASSNEISQAMVRADRQAGQSGGVLGSLQRQFVGGYRAADDFEKAIVRLGRGIEVGAVPLDRIDNILKGIYQKYGMTANAAGLLANGQTALGNAVTELNAKLASQEAAMNGVALSQAKAARSFAVANDNNTLLAASSKNSTFQLRMMALQLSQVVQQAQAGGGILRALAIQIPDMATGFGPVGIAAGIAAGAALSYYAAVSDSSGQSASALQQQADLIRRVAETWGDAIPPIREYAQALRDAQSLADMQQASTATAEGILSKVRETMSGLNDEQEAYATYIRQAAGATGEQRTVMSELGSAYLTLEHHLKNGSVTLKDFRAVQDAATKAAATEGFDEIGKFGSAFDAATGKVTGLLQKLEQLRVASTGQGRMLLQNNWRSFNSETGKLGLPDQSADGPIINSGFSLPEIGPIPTSRGTPELSGFPWELQKKSSRRSESDYERTIRRIKEGTEAAREETRVIDLATYARERQSAVQDILTTAKREGLEVGKAFANAQELISASTYGLTPKLATERDRILSVADAYAQAQADAERAEEAQRKFKAAMEFAKDTTRGFMDDFRGALSEGATIWEAFSKAALNALDKIVNKLLDDVMDAIFQVNQAGAGGNGGGGFWSMIGQSISGLFGGGNSGYASLPMVGPVPTVRPNALGGTYSSRSLSAFSNQIVDRPTYFAFAKGAGLMGEAGPEAIMPLRRDAAGRLGVSVSGGGSLSAVNDNASGRTVIQIMLSSGLIAEILDRAHNQSVEIVADNERARENYRQNGGNI